MSFWVKKKGLWVRNAPGDLLGALFFKHLSWVDRGLGLARLWGMGRRLHLWAFCLLAALLTGCGSGSAPTGGGSSPVPIEIPASSMSIEDLPRVTAPVVAVSSGNLGAVVKAVSANSGGLIIAEVENSTFSAGDSAAGCFAAGYAQDVLSAAATNDYYLCLIQSTVGALSEDELGFDLYDGAYHIVRLLWSGSTYMARIRVDRDTTSITDFELNLCAGSQFQYTSQTLTANADGTRSLAARAIHTGLGNDIRIKTDVTVTGTLNDEHQLLSKTVRNRYNLYVLNPDQWCDWSSTQTTSTLSFNGACDDGADGWTQQRFAFDLRDNNSSTAVADYTPKLLAMGDGGLVAALAGGTVSLNQAWTYADPSLAPSATANSYLTDARAMTAATLPEEFAVAFTADQTWSCSGTSEATITVNPGSLYSSCGKYIDISAEDRPTCDGLDSTDSE